MERVAKAYKKFYRNAGEVIFTSELERKRITLPEPNTYFGRTSRNKQKLEIVKEFAIGVISLVEYLERDVMFVNHDRTTKRSN